MLSFASSFNPEKGAFAIFVNEKYDYKDKKGILSKNIVGKIDSFLSTLKAKKEKEEIISFDVSNGQKCFIIRIIKKSENYYKHIVKT